MDILPQRPHRPLVRKVAKLLTVLIASSSLGLISAGIPALGTEGDPGIVVVASEPLPTATVTPAPEPSPEQSQPPPPPPPPAPSYPALPANSGTGRRVVYSNSQQRVWLVEGNEEVVGSWLVSGRKGMPRAGTYSVFSKSRHTTAHGGRLRMEYMTRFARGRRLAIGFHSIPVNRKSGKPIQTESELGQFRSAGCVRQSAADAARLWDFAPKGTKVVVTN